MDLIKRFSIAHHDNSPNPSQYYEAIRNSSQTFRDELCDIYFGKKFRYTYREQEIYDSYPKSHEITYGNVMGVEASDEQVDYLFKIQTEFGIRISLTINQLNIPFEFFYSKNNRVTNAFICWLQEFYDRGLRSCTLANNHLMRTGVLQAKFPEMLWKNTVNQQVSNAQQVLDYLYLGYSVIQLDRSLNRNMDELKRIKDAVENFKNKYPDKHVKTCMLVLEHCMPSCPFKREHDDLQIYHRRIDYWKSYLGALSCGRWRGNSGQMEVPRFGTNWFWRSVETFEEFAGLVDIFKLSGRLGNKIHTIDHEGRIQFGWSTDRHASDSFSNIVNRRLEPLYIWSLCDDGAFTYLETDVNVIKKDLSKDDFWMTEQANKLEQKLKYCKSQCYSCHLCEDTFGLPHFDSLLEL